MLQGAVAGLDGEREAGIGFGIFMADMDRGMAGQGAQLVERLPHLLHCSLDHATAAHGEQRIAGKQYVLGRDVIDDMTLGMAGRVDDLHLAPGKGEGVAARNGLVDARNGPVIARSDDGTSERFLQREIAFDVVAMMMGGENMGELPALGLELAFDGGGIGRIDRGGGTAAAVVDQNAVIVVPADEMMHIEMRHRTPNRRNL